LAGVLTPLLVLGLAIFDTTLVTISRARRGLLPFASPGKDHTAHRLTNLGLGQRRAVLFLYAAAALSGAAAVLVSRLSSRSALLASLTAVLAAFGAIAFLESVPYERQTATPPGSAPSIVE